MDKAEQYLWFAFRLMACMLMTMAGLGICVAIWQQVLQ